MSSQASSAGHGEKEVRQKIVQTGDVDVIISIRSNFFYSRTVPCELWFFDRAKPAERQDKVLLLDARQVYRKVTRKISRPLSGSTEGSRAASWRWCRIPSALSAPRAPLSRQSSLPSRRRLPTCTVASRASSRAWTRLASSARQEKGH